MGTFWVACDTFLGISVIGHSAREAFLAVSEAIAARLEEQYSVAPDLTECAAG
jgi:predicted RNase H-like HicB family nuclease